MIHKFKSFLRKIRNWLSSLSKWAQKHKLKLFTIILSIFLLISTIVTCKKNNKSASASSMSSSHAFIVVPSFSTEFRLGASNVYYTGSVMNFFLSYSSSQDAIILYVPRASSPTAGLVYRAVTLVRDEYAYSGSSTTYFVLNVLEGNTSRYYDVSNVDVAYHFGIRYGDPSTTTFQYYNMLVNNCSSINLIIDSGISYYQVIYQFMDNTGDVVMSLYFSPMPIETGNSGTYVNFSSFNIILGADINDAVQILLNNSYNDGYLSGYNNGYNIGLAVNFDDYTLGKWFSQSISEFLTSDIFGFFSFADLIGIAAGSLLFGLLLKLFLGG